MSESAAADSQPLTKGKWFGTMTGVALLLAAGAAGLQYLYSDNKIEQIFHKERKEGASHK